MRFPDLILEFNKLVHRVDGLLFDVADLRRQLHNALTAAENYRGMMAKSHENSRAAAASLLPTAQPEEAQDGIQGSPEVPGQTSILP